MIFITAALSNLVPRGCDPFGLRHGSRLLARSNSGSSRFTDFPSLCAFSESSLTNLIGSGLNLLCLQSHSKPECHWTWPGVLIFPAHDKRDPWVQGCVLSFNCYLWEVKSLSPTHKTGSYLKCRTSTTFFIQANPQELALKRCIH